MSTRTPEESIGKLEILPAVQLLDFLAALASGDLEGAKKAGGGITRAQLADLQPTGATGQLLDTLEQRALFQLARKVGLAVMRALPGAVDVLWGIAQGPACIGDVEAAMDKSDVPLVDPQLAPHEQEAVQREAMRAIAAARVPNPKNLEQKRIAALGLVDLAKTLELFTSAKEFRAGDEEAEFNRRAEEQGLGDMLGLPGNGNKPERLLRSVR